ncbi:hypothetical protein [Microbacterium sp.]
MATANLPTPALQPAPQPDAADKPLLQIIEDGGSCCGGGSCAI